MIDQHLYAYLSGNTTITNACSRIYAIAAPADVAFPLITYMEVSNDRIRSWDGTNPLIQAQVVVDVWAATKLDAANIANVILSELEDYTGSMGTKTIEQCDIENAVLSFDPDTGNYGAGIDLTIFYH